MKLKSLNKIVWDLLSRQEELPPEMAKVLHDNLWDLYEPSSPQPAIQDVPTDKE